MSAFEYMDDDEQLDFAILSSGPVGLFRSADQLAGAVETLAGLGYQVVRFDASGWRSESELFDAFVGALDFPSYFGRNWDAFEEVISDIGSGDLSWPQDATGLIITIEHADDLSKVSRRATRLLVESFADASRLASLYGNRFILILQVHERTARSLTDATSSVARWQ
ncbi:barstar family protein [uncultured Amnibacterium sp.]|uniref:barstar family protein n=1 Tax=uncultured Amnibacterium sp. TaxID=1631851 RepID=UPI0035C96B1B